MKTRSEIQVEISIKKDQIGRLNSNIKNLEREALMLSDSKQQYTEKEEQHTFKEGRKNVVKTVLVGRIHWKESYIDESTGKRVYIQRSRMVKQGGEWLV